MRARTLTTAMVVALSTCPVYAGSFAVELLISPTSAIFLAGRDDVTIPELGQSHPSFPLTRHFFVSPDFNREQFPQEVAVEAGDVIRLSDPVIGGINFFNGLGPPFYGPDGDGGGGSNLFPLAGLSGFIGPRGSLTGVFLSDLNPVNTTAPLTLDFSDAGLGRNQAQLNPELGQIFYIGNGVTDSDEFQRFVAPAGATRLFLGIADGFGFSGPPGAYEDNDASTEGGFKVIVGVNAAPVIVPDLDPDPDPDLPPPTVIPLPPAVWAGGALLAGIFARKRLRARA